jgi:SPP1 family predicted phage head-tail adaptor
VSSREPWRPQRIGNLRERVNLIEPVTTGTSPLGEPILQLVDRGTFHARVEPLKGDERMRGGGVTQTHTLLVHIRHRDDIGPDWRIIWRGRSYGITARRNLDERRRFLTLDCTEMQ